MAEKQVVHIVDDEDGVRRSLDFLLRTAGYDTRRWENGEQFLKRVDKATPACVLLDIRMPGLDGLEVQRRMPEAGLDFPVIVLTGHGEVSSAVQAMQAGATDFITKPFEREQLLASVALAFRQNANLAALCAHREWAVAQLGKLTAREREVLDGLACGYPNKTIAFDLQISARTVEAYRANIMAKLHVSYFAEALRIAFAAGLGSDRVWSENHSKVGKGQPALSPPLPTAT
ncbi:MAG: response regulator transcription factor [Erythrobacter sp.]|nr:MAG: response regulator transcription factor [Erythrobacter sp.]